MPRYIGVKGGVVKIVSDDLFSDSELEVIELPFEMQEVSAQDLMSDYRVKKGRVESKKQRKKAKELKIAFVTNWAMQCGIASYSNDLFLEISKHVKDFKLFIEENKNPIKPINYIGNQELDKDKVIQCWKRGESLHELVKEIKDYDPDIALISHEFGIWPSASKWISMMNQLSDYRVIVIMHSVFEHKDKTIIEASIPEIIVHLEGARRVLKEVKKISARVNVIKHGTFPCTDASKLWNFYKSDHTFMQQGFLFRYKGFQNSIEAVHLLVSKYPDVFFTGLCSESPLGKMEHDNYYKELMDMVEKYGIEENVGLIRGYQSDEVLDSFLRMNAAAVFPYVSDKDHVCYGSSGASPYAMSKGIPVITSSIPHFSELPSIKADSPEEIAEQLDRIFSDKQVGRDQVVIQNKYLEDNSWHNTALKYIKVFES